MKSHFVNTVLIVFLSFLGFNAFGQVSQVTEISPEEAPVMTFVNQSIDIGDMKEGQTVPMIFRFTNTGKTSLFIEHISACKCSDIQWTDGEIRPGEEGEIHVLFDSKGYAGLVEKTVDIVANTDPIVVEAFFKANVLKSDN